MTLEGKQSLQGHQSSTSIWGAVSWDGSLPAPAATQGPLSLWVDPRTRALYRVHAARSGCSANIVPLDGGNCEPGGGGSESNLWAAGGVPTPNNMLLPAAFPATCHQLPLRRDSANCPAPEGPAQENRLGFRSHNGILFHADTWGILYAAVIYKYSHYTYHCYYSVYVYSF